MPERPVAAGRVWEFLVIRMFAKEVAVVVACGDGAGRVFDGLGKVHLN